jgi:DNA-binding Lrp family transcriptional regulator
LDKVDIKLLAALEKNARVSLKNLAKDLKVKTSTIYHRLHKLKEANILDRFTIVINPEEVGLTLHALFSIRLTNMIIGKLDKMFLESFANYLAEQYPECLFSATGSDEQIWLICTFKNEAHYQDFKKVLQENPYIEDSQPLRLTKILKGKKIFTFDHSLISSEDTGEYFDDSGDDEDVADEEEEKNTSEVFF